MENLCTSRSRREITLFPKSWVTLEQLWPPLYINTMPACVKAVIKAKGGNTKFWIKRAKPFKCTSSFCDSLSLQLPNMETHGWAWLEARKHRYTITKSGMRDCFYWWKTSDHFRNGKHLKGFARHCSTCHSGLYLYNVVTLYEVYGMQCDLK